MRERKYNAVKHGLYFSGIMRCGICGIKDCPLFEEGEFCAKEIATLSELKGKGILTIRNEIIRRLGIRLILLEERIRIQSAHKKIAMATQMKMCDMMTKYVTASKGKLEVEDQMELWKELIKKFKEEED